MLISTVTFDLDWSEDELTLTDRPIPTQAIADRFILKVELLVHPEAMSIIISDQDLQRLQMSEAELLQEIAVMLFQQERFTLGQASRFAEMSQRQFQHLLASRQIPLHYDLDELREDVASLKANDWR